jgi:hypothetical protein
MAGELELPEARRSASFQKKLKPLLLEYEEEEGELEDYAAA